MPDFIIHFLKESKTKNNYIPRFQKRSGRSKDKFIASFLEMYLMS